ncbi:MAG: thioredoxin family protein [Bacteroidia bacterium]|nr:thioredoxin family protein [Bacteroidia bacterium]
MPFYTGTFDELRQAAQDRRLPYVVFFSADWCQPCLEMEATTLSDASVVAVLRQHYLLFNTRISDQARGTLISGTQEQVQFYPSLIICTPDGTERYRGSGLQSPEQLRALLVQFAALPPADPQPVQPQAPPAAPAATPEPAEGPQTPAPVPAGAWWVQTGAYSTLVNAQREQQWLASRYELPVSILPKMHNGKSLQRVLVGPFDSEARATEFEDRYRKVEGRSTLRLSHEQL